MNKLEALEVLKDLTLEEIRELRKKQDNKIKNGDKYYVSNINNEINSFIYDNDGLDKKTFKNCILHKTKEEQEKYKKYCQAYIRIINWIRKHNDGWKPDFENINQVKYFVKHSICARLILDWDFTNAYSYIPMNMYLKSSELALQLIEEMHDDLITYFTYDNFDWWEV